MVHWIFFSSTPWFGSLILAPHGLECNQDVTFSTKYNAVPWETYTIISNVKWLQAVFLYKFGKMSWQHTRSLFSQHTFLTPELQATRWLQQNLALTKKTITKTKTLPLLSPGRDRYIITLFQKVFVAMQTCSAPMNWQVFVLKTITWWKNSPFSRKETWTFH